LQRRDDAASRLRRRVGDLWRGGARGLDY